jgi:hypothetical protein
MAEDQASHGSGSGSFEQRYWLLFGALFSIVTIGFLVVAFRLPEISCDRWKLLQFILPVFTGIAAGAFVGAITANGSINGLTIAAAGGFAVWLISLTFIGPPDRCRVVQVSVLRLIENRGATGEPGKRYPASLDKKEGAYDASNAEDFAFFVAASIDNISSTADGSVDLDVEVVGLKADGSPAWSEPDHFSSFNDWKNLDLVKKFTPAETEKKLGIADSTGKFVLVWSIECFTPEQLIDWTGHFTIKVTDHQQRHGEGRGFASVSLRPSSSVPTSSCTTCKRL